MKRKQVTFRCCITFTYSQIVYCPDWTCVWMFWSPSRFVERKWIFKTCHLAFKYYVRYIIHILICFTLINLPLWQLLWTRFYSHPFFHNLVPFVATYFHDQATLSTSVLLLQAYDNKWFMVRNIRCTNLTKISLIWIIKIGLQNAGHVSLHMHVTVDSLFYLST